MDLHIFAYTDNRMCNLQLYGATKKIGNLRQGLVIQVELRRTNLQAIQYFWNYINMKKHWQFELMMRNTSLDDGVNRFSRMKKWTMNMYSGDVGKNITTACTYPSDGQWYLKILRTKWALGNIVNVNQSCRRCLLWKRTINTINTSRKLFNRFWVNRHSQIPQPCLPALQWRQCLWHCSESSESQTWPISMKTIFCQIFSHLMKTCSSSPLLAVANRNSDDTLIRPLVGLVLTTKVSPLHQNEDSYWHIGREYVGKVLACSVSQHEQDHPPLAPPLCLPPPNSPLQLTLATTSHQIIIIIDHLQCRIPSSISLLSLIPEVNMFLDQTSSSHSESTMSEAPRSWKTSEVVRSPASSKR